MLTIVHTVSWYVFDSPNYAVLLCDSIGKRHAALALDERSSESYRIFTWWGSEHTDAEPCFL